MKIPLTFLKRIVGDKADDVAKLLENPPSHQIELIKVLFLVQNVGVKVGDIK